MDGEQTSQAADDRQARRPTSRSLSDPPDILATVAAKETTQNSTEQTTTIRKKTIEKIDFDKSGNFSQLLDPLLCFWFVFFPRHVIPVLSGSV